MPILESEASLEHVRKACRFATYRGDHREMVGRLLVGPTLATEEYLTAVRADFDDETDRTRIGFAYGPVVEGMDKAAGGTR